MVIIHRPQQYISAIKTPSVDADGVFIAFGACLEHVMSLILDRYEVIRPLGQGAFGTTMLCRDVELERDVAIKQMALSSVDEWKSYDLFERESRVLRRLNHDGIPTFYDVFRVEEDTAYFCLVQEYIQGHTLQWYIDQETFLPPECVTPMIEGLLDILGYLHDQTPPIIHRDIKPSNIILRDSTYQPVLIDFGSVCDVWREEGEAGSTIAGTYGYMAPEQYMGQVTARSDLYAFAGTVFHALTHRSPSTLSMDTGRPTLPHTLAESPGLTRLIEQCLSLAPNDRPESAHAARRLLVEDRSVVIVNQALATQNERPHQPQLVELAPPPRQREDYPEVYDALVCGLFSIRHDNTIGIVGANDNGLSLFVIIAMIVMMPLTLGIMPFFIYYSYRQSAREMGALYERGVLVIGEIQGVEALEDGTSKKYKLTYRYTANHQRYERECVVMHDRSVLFEYGAPITVLHDPEDHAQATCVVG